MFDTLQQRKPGAVRGRDSAKQASHIQQQQRPVSGLSAKADTQRQQSVEQVETALRQFDLSSDYGPCVGMTRLQRWTRAERLGLHPDPMIKRLLEEHQELNESIWHGRV